MKLSDTGPGDIFLSSAQVRARFGGISDMSFVAMVS